MILGTTTNTDMCVLLSVLIITTTTITTTMVSATQFRSRGFVHQDPPFVILAGVSWGECLAECGRRGSCDNVLFRRHTQTCRLYDREASETLDGPTPGTVYGIKAWRPIQILPDPCSMIECSVGFTCIPDGSCVRTECGHPPQEPSSEIRGNMRQVGSRVQYRCLPDHTNVTDVVTCLDTGEWSARSSVCDCGSPLGVANTQSGENGTHLGSTVQYFCKTGYSYSGGSNVSTCVAESGWTVPSLVCDIDCGEFPAVDNANTTGNTTTLGSEVTVSCNTGYLPDEGISTAECMESGTWSPVTVVCTIVDCGPPPSSPIRVVQSSVTSTNYGDAVNLSCTTGYRGTKFHPSQTALTCQSNGTWSDSVFDCVVNKTGVAGFVVYKTDAYAVQSDTVLATYGPAVYHGVTLYQCMDMCRAETVYGTLVSYYPANQTCMLAEDPGISYTISSIGWDVLYEVVGVQFYQGPNGWYTLNFPDAQQHCIAMNMTMAAISDIQAAYDKGYNIGQCGWIQEEYAAIALHFPIPDIYPYTGINTCIWRTTWGVFCKV